VISMNPRLSFISIAIRPITVRLWLFEPFFYPLRDTLNYFGASGMKREHMGLTKFSKLHMLLKF
jgi:hypothetical protein